MGRVVGCPGSVINGISGNRVVGRTIEINSMSSTAEDMVTSYHVADRSTASVIDSDSLARRPRNCVSGDDVVLSDVRAVANDHAPAVAVEMISCNCIPLAPDDVDSVVCAREDCIAGYRFTPSITQVETVAVASAYVATEGVVIACTVIHAVAV